MKTAEAPSPHTPWLQPESGPCASKASSRELVVSFSFSLPQGLGRQAGPAAAFWALNLYEGEKEWRWAQQIWWMPACPPFLLYGGRVGIAGKGKQGSMDHGAGGYCSELLLVPMVFLSSGIQGYCLNSPSGLTGWPCIHLWGIDLHYMSDTNMLYEFAQG